MGWMSSQDFRVGEGPAALWPLLTASQDSCKALPCANRSQGRDQEVKQKTGLWAEGVLEHQAQRWPPLVPEPAGAPGRRFLGNLADTLGSGLEKSIDPK